MSDVRLRILDYDNVLFVSFVPLWFRIFLSSSDALASDLHPLVLIFASLFTQ